MKYVQQVTFKYRDYAYVTSELLSDKTDNNFIFQRVMHPKLFEDIHSAQKTYSLRFYTTKDTKTQTAPNNHLSLKRTQFCSLTAHRRAWRKMRLRLRQHHIQPCRPQTNQMELMARHPHNSSLHFSSRGKPDSQYQRRVENHRTHAKTQHQTQNHGTT